MKKIKTICVTMLLSLIFVSQAFAFGWYRNPAGQWYYFRQDGSMIKDSWANINNRWYVFIGDGSMVKDQWILSEGKWYYINIDGGMLSNQWLGYKGEWYWLQNDGSMLVDGKAPDGSRIDAEGHLMGYSAAGPAGS